LSLIGNGKIKSPLQRGKERVSGVFFCYPDFEAKIPKVINQEFSLFKEARDGKMY